MKVLLTPEERRGHYSGVSSPREELLGDTLELALGVLSLAMRYPSHFPFWGGLDGASACVRGLERSFWRYASAEAVELITADAPRKRSQPKRDEAIVSFINGMTEGLSIEFLAVLENDMCQPGSGGPGKTTGEKMEGQREEYASAPPMPDVEINLRKKTMNLRIQTTRFTLLLGSVP